MCCLARGHFRANTRACCHSHANTRVCGCLTGVRAHASSLAVALRDGRTVLSRGHARADTHRDARPRTQCVANASVVAFKVERPVLLQASGSSRGLKWPQMSLERADSCIVAHRVDRTVAHPADHRQRTQPDSRTLTCVRTQRCRTRGIARERSHGSALTGARNTRHRTHCLAGHASSPSRSNAQWLARPATGGVLLSCV